MQRELGAQQRSWEHRLWVGSGSMGVGHVARVAGCRKLETECRQSLSNINSSCACLVFFGPGFALGVWGLLLILIPMSSHSGVCIVFECSQEYELQCGMEWGVSQAGVLCGTTSEFPGWIVEEYSCRKNVDFLDTYFLWTRCKQKENAALVFSIRVCGSLGNIMQVGLVYEWSCFPVIIGRSWAGSGDGRN